MADERSLLRGSEFVHDPAGTAEPKTEPAFVDPEKLKAARDGGLASEEPLIDARGNLTPAGEELAIKKGWRVQGRDGGGGGLTGYLKE